MHPIKSYFNEINLQPWVIIQNEKTNEARRDAKLKVYKQSRKPKSISVYSILPTPINFIDVT